MTKKCPDCGNRYPTEEFCWNERLGLICGPCHDDTPEGEEEWDEIWEDELNDH